MSYLEELLPEFRKGAKIRCSDWNDDEYICIKNGIVVDENGVYHKDFYDKYLLSNEWEFYKEPEPDWDYIIKNKCLCWFWDDEEEFTVMDKLYEIRDDNEFKFVRNFKGIKLSYIHCCPVRRDEVTFYEDKEND